MTTARLAGRLFESVRGGAPLDAAEAMAAAAALARLADGRTLPCRCCKRISDGRDVCANCWVEGGGADPWPPRRGAL